MSLVNQMLRDLDRRHATAVDRAALPSAVHVQSVLRRTSKPFAVVTLLALAALVAAGWYVMGREGAGSAAPRPQAPPPVPAPAPQPAPAPAPAPQVQAAAVETPLPAPELMPAPKELLAAPLAIAAKPVPAADRPAPARRATSPDSAQEPKKAAAASRPAPLAAAPSAPAARELPPADAGSIDKRSRAGPGREAAENEYRKAMTALRRGATTEALDGLRVALRQDASHASVRQALLSVLVEQQQWGEAQRLMEEGLALDPAQIGWAMALARLHVESGKVLEATDTLVRHGGHAEQNADYQAFHAVLLQKQKRYREAVERYRAALALKSAEARWWYGMGLSLDADQKPHEAHEAFLKAREIGNLPPELANALERRLH